MNLLRIFCLIGLWLSVADGWASASPRLDELCRTAAREKTLSAYSAVCRHLYQTEADPVMLAAYADSIRRLPQADDSPECRVEYLAWTAESHFQQGDFATGYALKRQAVALAEREGLVDYLVDCASDMGYYYNVDARYDSARFYLCKGMRASEDVPELSEAYRVMLTNYASSYLYEGKTDSALIYALRAERRSAIDRDTALWIENLNQLGTIYRRQRNLDGCIRSFEEALKLCEVQGNFHTAAYIYGNVATVYCEWNRPEEALPISEKSLYYALKEGNRQMIAICHINLGAIQANLDTTRQQGIGHLLQAVDLLKQLDNRRRLCEAYNLLVNAYRQEGQLDVAQSYLNHLDSLAHELRTEVERYRYYSAKAFLLQARQHYAEAAVYYKRAIDMLESGYRDTNDFDLYHGLAECSHLLGRNREAVQYYHKAYALRDSSYRQSNARLLSYYTVKEQVKEKELEITRLEQKQLEQNAAWLKHTAMLGGIILIAIIALLVLLNIRQRQHTRLTRLAHAMAEKERQFLELQKETEQRLTRNYIAGLESERQRMASELHDDVCNSLLSLEMSVRSLPSVADGSQDSQLEQLASIRQHVRNISHELMPPAFQYANLHEMLSDYVAHLSLPGSTRAVYTATEGVDWSALPKDIGLAIYRIAQESVGNAVKYAEATCIRVSLRWQDDELALCVADDGKGFDVARKQKGIGLRTIYQRAEAIGATVGLTSQAGRGTTLTVNVRMQ